jgi:hypothetical protein
MNWRATSSAFAARRKPVRAQGLANKDWPSACFLFAGVTDPLGRAGGKIWEQSSTQLCTCTTSTISSLAKVATKIKAVTQFIQTINFNVNTFFTAARNKFGW